jgi:hypothetical protein
VVVGYSVYFSSFGIGSVFLNASEIHLPSEKGGDGPWPPYSGQIRGCMCIYIFGGKGVFFGYSLRIYSRKIFK